MPDGAVLTDDGALMLEDIAPAPSTLVMGGSRVIASSALRESINLRSAPITRVLLNVPHRERRLAGTALLFGGNGNFSHLVNDYLSKLVWFDRFPKWQRVVLSAACHPAAEGFLTALGVPSDAIVRLRPNERARPERLVVPSVNHRFPDLPIGHLAWLRDRFRQPTPCGSKRRRLFFSRAGAVGRNVTNADALRSLCVEFAIEEIRLDLLSLQAQLDVLASCELVIGATGGGSATFYFVPDDCAIIELYYSGVGVLSHRPARLLAQLGHAYRSVECRRVAFRSMPDADGDLSVPIADLRSAILDVLRDRASSHLRQPELERRCDVG